MKGVTVSGFNFNNDVITNIADCDVNNLTQWNICLREMKNKMASKTYYFDEANKIDQTPIVRKDSKIKFGAIKIPVVIHENLEKMTAKTQ